jgi:hypothetical protein
VKYTTENEIMAVVRGFEDATIARGVWKHAEHLVVALYYATTHPSVDDAIETMRRGLFNLLTEGFKVDLTKEMPYHETLTVFWMRTVADFNAARTGMSLVDKTNEVIETFDKDYPLRYYSREYLFSDEARGRFVDGDLETAAFGKAQ